MHNATHQSQLLGTIGQIERSLSALRLSDDAELRLRLRIEEAIETGYEVVYARPVRRASATVIAFPSRAACEG